MYRATSHAAERLGDERKVLLRACPSFDTGRRALSAACGSRGDVALAARRPQRAVGVGELWRTRSEALVAAVIWTVMS